jgi:demethylmenaquinone methyltransferase/2-methoxy-6-polyprenyl-1,4-benzoquinol methylase
MILDLQNEPSRRDVAQMFNKISSRYDLLNRILSFGQDIFWRKRIVKETWNKQNLYILDVGTGTADVLVTILKKNPHIKYGIGIDIAKSMLEIGQHKIIQMRAVEKLKLMPGDSMNIPLSDNKFHVVTIAFGIRNVLNIEQCLEEMYRVLISGCKVIILEFSIPKTYIIKRMYLFYLRNIVPIIGNFISGDNYAYRYLNETIETFPYGSKFSSLMEKCGFSNVRFKYLTFGVAAIYVGEKK